MARVDEFDAFYDGTRRHVLHLAYAFTGDLQAATAATQDAYASAWQHWSKLRGGEPLDVVRPESLSVAALRHGAHLVRRKPPPEADAELIGALRALSSGARRMVLLQTIGDLDLAHAAREVGVTFEEGRQLTEASVGALEHALSLPIRDIERRLHEMHAHTDAALLPRASVIRRTGSRRHHRSTALAVTAGAAILLGGGYFVTAPVAPTQAGTPPRSAATTDAPEPEPLVPAGPSVHVVQLLDADTISELGPRAGWRETTTSDGLRNQDPLALCAQGRFASPRLLTGLTRTFRGDLSRRETAAQTVELAGSEAAAERAYETHLGWYSGCQEPRVQLLESYTVRRTGGDTVILVLREWSDPAVTMTVGIGRTGAAMTTLVHQATSGGAAPVDAFAAMMDTALLRLCSTTDGDCQDSRPPRPTPPPSTGEGSGFLGVVDLPPVATLAKVWGGTEPLRWRPNPPATPCDAADFSDGPELARSRTYVVPGAEQVPLTFGIGETIARFRTERAARAFADRTAEAVDLCDEDNPGASVSDPVRARRGPITATVWRMTFSVADDEEVTYRVGIVVAGNRVAQVTFSPVGRFDIDQAAYEQLLLRAGERLSELPDR
jgi:DNA-directed RNA polymerase specialized sigma24 family protein